MTAISTRNGASFDLAGAHATIDADISILDIAHSLACINRFTGHAQWPYNVAQHSLLVCEVMEREHGVSDVGAKLAALMHDAHEAYTGDLSSPLKTVLHGMTHGEWRRFERTVQRRVLQRFAAYDHYERWGSLIHHCDLVALATERRDLMPPNAPAWPVLAGIEPVTWCNLNTPENPMSWLEWRQAFLDRFASLFHAHTQTPLDDCVPSAGALLHTNGSATARAAA